MELFDFVRTSDKIRIHSIEEKEIEQAEKRMQFRFPEELRCFYSDIGYGFIKGSKSFTNRIMSPDDSKRWKNSVFWRSNSRFIY